jgi:hypothetical protein
MADSTTRTHAKLYQATEGDRYLLYHMPSRWSRKVLDPTKCPVVVVTKVTSQTIHVRMVDEPTAGVLVFRKSGESGKVSDKFKLGLKGTALIRRPNLGPPRDLCLRLNIPGDVLADAKATAAYWRHKAAKSKLQQMRNAKEAALLAAESKAADTNPWVIMDHLMPPGSPSVYLSKLLTRKIETMGVEHSITVAVLVSARLDQRVRYDQKRDAVREGYEWRADLTVAPVFNGPSRMTSSRCSSPSGTSLKALLAACVADAYDAAPRM